MATSPTASERENGVYAFENKTAYVGDAPVHVAGNDESDEREFGETKELRQVLVHEVLEVCEFC
jgi:hypothetical protein